MLFRKILLTACMSLFFFTSTNATSLLQEMSGHEFAFTDLQGKWVLINYWASWCQPCVDEIPELNRFYDANKQNNIAMYAVNYDALPINAQKILIKQFNIRYPSLKEDPSDTLRLGDIRGVPVTFVFNPQGELSDTLYGGQTMSSLRAAVAQ